MRRPKEEAKRWLLQAEDDLRFVEWVWKEGVFFDKGCFISQQAGEKVLKACLYITGKRLVLGHSLFEMVLELTKKIACLKRSRMKPRDWTDFIFQRVTPMGYQVVHPSRFIAQRISWRLGRIW